MKNQKHLFAIIRFDKYKLEDKEISDIDAIINAVTVKQVVTDLEEAEKEVKRLNELNGHKDCLYYWQTTRQKIEENQ